MDDSNLKQCTTESTPSKSEKRQVRQITLGLVLGWIFGGFFLFGGIVSLFINPLDGAISILIGLLIFPPANAYVLNKWYIRLSWVLKVVIICLLVGLMGWKEMRKIDESKPELKEESRSKVNYQEKEVVRKIDESKPELKEESRSKVNYQEKEVVRKIDESKPNIPRIGEKAVVGYFEICVNSVYITTKLQTGNMFLDKEAEQGNQFIILDVTFKCIDNESRMPMEGSLFMNIEGRMYEFDNTETVMASGWGLFFDQLNPFTSKTTKIVYMIPRDVKADVYWVPGRNPQKVMFYCGTF